MQKVFFSKKHEETGEVKKLKAFLESCFVDCWLDETDLLMGAGLNEAFYQAIREYSIFIPFISERYLSSNYCRLEFSYAHEEKVKGRCKVIPVVLGDRKKILEIAEDNKWFEMVRTLESAACVNLNPYDPRPDYDKILSAIHEETPIRFSPIQYLEVEGVQIQRIDYTTKDQITFNDFMNWKLDFSNFIEKQENEGLPVKKNRAVAVYARGAGWALAYVTLQFANKFKIYMYNGHEKGYLCVHAPGQKNEMGRVLFE